jgi:hypothetical protein
VDTRARIIVIVLVSALAGVALGAAGVHLAQRQRLQDLESRIASLASRVARSEASATAAVAERDRAIEELAAETGSRTAEPPAEQPQGITDSPASERRFAYLRSIDPGDPGELVADLARFLTGEAAAQAATADGAESPPPNDYYVVNDDASVQTLPVDADAEVTLTSRPGAGSSAEGYRSSVAALAGYLAEDTEATAMLRANGFWLVVRDGVVVAIEEQYTP